MPSDTVLTHCIITDHLESNIQRWSEKYAQEPASASTSLKRQRRFAKYERELLNCGQDIHALSRFCRAQVTAFRKILKKYKVCLACRLFRAQGLCNCRSHSLTQLDRNGPARLP